MSNMVPPYGPWGQPQPIAMPTQPASPYGAQAPQAAQLDPFARVLPFIQQAEYLRTRLTAGQQAILLVIAAVGKRTNNHPYFPSPAEQGDMQVLQ